MERNEQKSQSATPKRLLTLQQVIVYSPYQRGGESNASILREVPCQEGNEGHQGYNHEEWQAGNPGCMSSVWHQDVQDWEELKPRLRMSELSIAGQSNWAYPAS